MQFLHQWQFRFFAYAFILLSTYLASIGLKDYIEILPYLSIYIIYSTLHTFSVVILLLNYSEDGYVYFGPISFIFSLINMTYAFGLYVHGYIFTSGVVTAISVLVLLSTALCFWGGVPERLYDEDDYED
jgi:hypothetical protein